MDGAQLVPYGVGGGCLLIVATLVLISRVRRVEAQARADAEQQQQQEGPGGLHAPVHDTPRVHVRVQNAPPPPQAVLKACVSEIDLESGTAATDSDSSPVQAHGRSETNLKAAAAATKKPLADLDQRRQRQRPDREHRSSREQRSTREHRSHREHRSSREHRSDREHRSNIIKDGEERERPPPVLDAKPTTGLRTPKPAHGKAGTSQSQQSAPRPPAPSRPPPCDTASEGGSCATVTPARPNTPGSACKRQTTSSFLAGEHYERMARCEMSDVMRQRIDGMRHELRHERAAPTPRRDVAAEAVASGCRRPRADIDPAVATPRSTRTPRVTAGLSFTEQRRELRRSREQRQSREHTSAAAPSQPERAAEAAAGSACAPTIAITPRKERIEPPSAVEAEEMAVFVAAETARRRQQAEAARADNGLFTLTLTPTLPLTRTQAEAARADAGLRDASNYSVPAKLHETRQMRHSARREASDSHRGGRDGGSDDGGGGGGDARPPPQGGVRQKRRPSRAGAHVRTTGAGALPASAAAPMAPAPPPLAKQPSNVAALRQRAQREADEQQERVRHRLQAERLLVQWQARTQGDVYAMLGSCALFTDLFSNDPLGGKPVPRGDAAALKKAWHKLAARLHPDRQRQNPTASQVLAEEVFKKLSLAYQKEAERLGLQA